MNKKICMHLFWLITFFSITPHSPAAENEDPFTYGNALLQTCTASDNFLKSICMSYIAGVVAGISSHVNFEKQRPYFCLPAASTLEQTKDIVVKFLRSNSGKRHVESSSLIYASVIEAFPCKAK